MNDRRCCSGVEDLLAPFAIHAVEPDEHDLVERHLEGCPRCASEVNGFRESAAMLAFVGGPAPARVWDGIVSSFELAAPDGAWEGIVAAFERPGSPPVASEQPSGRRPGRWPAAVAAVALAALGLAGASFLAGPGGDGPRAAALTPGAIGAFADPRSDDLWLRSPGGDVAARLVRGTDGRGFVITGQLPALDSDRAYQLWALPAAGDPQPVALLGGHGGVVPFEHHGEAAGFAITEEPSAGAMRFHGAPVVSGHLAPPQ